MATRNLARKPVDVVVYPIIYRVLCIPGGLAGFLYHQQCFEYNSQNHCLFLLGEEALNTLFPHPHGPSLTWQGQVKTTVFFQLLWAWKIPEAVKRSAFQGQRGMRRKSEAVGKAFNLLENWFSMVSYYIFLSCRCLPSFSGTQFFAFFWDVLTPKHHTSHKLRDRNLKWCWNMLRLENRMDPCIAKLRLVLLIEGVRTSWYGKYPIIHRVLYKSGGAGFLPSTVSNSITVLLKLIWFQSRTNNPIGSDPLTRPPDTDKDMLWWLL